MGRTAPPIESSAPAAPANGESEEATKSGRRSHPDLRFGTLPDRRPRRRLLSNSQESALLFVIFFAIYAAIGYQLVIVQHVVVTDGLSRLAHAYFAWYNQPPKLAAIGFEWPPLMTMVFLPLAGIRPLATSFAALPLTSAIFGAGLLVILNRTLSTFAMRPLLRYPLVLLFGANPMIVFYATNGMGESVYLFFLTAAIYSLLRWYRNRQAHLLAIAGVAMALGILSRYEVAAFALVVAIGVLLIIAHRGASRVEISGSLTLYAAPIAYGLGAWFFFNWLILGDPFFWISRQAGTNISVGRGGQSEAAAGTLEKIPLGEIAGELLSLNAHLFPLTLLVVPALLVVVVVRRDLMALLLAALASLNALMTAAFVFNARDLSLLQLRYNMRAMPIALIGAGWLFWLLRGRVQQTTTWILTAVALAASIPLCWHLMDTYRYQFGEQGFVRAVRTGESLEGKTLRGGYRFNTGADRAMSDYILAHTIRRDGILTDDAQTFSVMLASGRPDLFRDRIDKGDRIWHRALRDPYGKVDYILVSRFGDPDQVRQCYPEILRGDMPGTSIAVENPKYLLLEVAPHAPPPQRPQSFPAECPLSGS